MIRYFLHGRDRDRDQKYQSRRPLIVRPLLTQKIDIIPKLSAYLCKKAISLYVDFKALDFIW